MKPTTKELDAMIVRRIFESHTDIETLRDKSSGLSDNDKELLLTRVSDSLFFILYVNGEV